MASVAIMTPSVNSVSNRGLPVANWGGVHGKPTQLPVQRNIVAGHARRRKALFKVPTHGVTIEGKDTRQFSNGLLGCARGKACYTLVDDLWHRPMTKRENRCSAC